MTEIPDAAVEAAFPHIKGLAGTRERENARASLEAAYPHLVAAAKREVLAELRERLETELCDYVENTRLNRVTKGIEIALSFIGDAERELA